MKGINVVRSCSLLLWNLQTRFQDPELEDEFLSSYVDNTLRWTWHACSSSVWWTIVRFVCMHLQIFNPSVYHLCCKKIYGINIGSEFAMWKYWSTIIELLSPLNGFIMLWKKERMQRYNLLFGLPFYASIFPSGCLIPKLKKCSAGSIPYQAVAYAIFEEQCVLFLMLSIICPLVGDGYYLTAHGQSQLCWIMAGVGTMLHMRYISHLVFTCMSAAVLLTSLIYTLVRQAWCSDMVSGSFIFCGISVASVCLARIREIRWRRHFVAQKRTQMLSEHLHSLLSTMLPADASEHLITTSSLHPTLDSNWGKIHDNVTILFVSINLNYKEGMMQEADSGALIEELNYIFSLLDAVLDQHTECYKVETVCNVYVVSAGVPSACEQHAQAAAALACHMAALLDQFLPPSGKAVSWQMGLHSGPLFAGIAGRICPRYRLFGDTMNTASRMCSVSARGGISASRAHIDCLINQHLQIPADLRSKVTVPIECWLRRDNAQGVEESVVECHNVRQHVDHVELHLSGRQHIKGKGVMEVWSLRPLIKALKQVPSAQEANHSNGAETDDVGLRASASMSATRGDNQRQTSGQESKSDNTRHLLPHAEIGEPRTKVEKDAEDNKQDSIHSQTAATSSYTAVTRVCGLNGAGSSVCGDSAAVRQAQAGQGTNDVGGRGRGEGQARGYWRDADGGARVGPHLRYRKSAGATSGECSFTNEASFGESASTFGESASTFPTHEAIFRDNSFDIDSIVLTCEEETAFLLASGSNGQGGWPKEQSRNAILERMYFRRRCIASLPRTFAAVVCVGTLSGVLLLLEMDILMSHPRLRPAAMLALCCWGAVALAGLVLGCIYYSSTQRGYRSETVVYRSQLSCHLQVASSTLAALSLYFLINFHYLERLSHWGGDSGKEGSEKVISTSETDFAGMLSAINSHWLPRTRGFVYMTSIVNIHDMIALFFCMMQVCFDLPLWCAICLVALNIQQKISYFKFAGADYALEIKTECSLRNYTYRQYMLTEQNVGLLALCGAVCVYNIWLTERLERKQWCILMKETSKRLRIRGVLSTLMPDFVLQACSRLGTVKSSRANSRRTRDLGFSKTTRSLFSSVSFLIGTNLSTSNKSADDWHSTQLQVPPRNFSVKLQRACLLMADVQGFTEIASKMTASKLFAAINEVFTKFDLLCDAFEVTKGRQTVKIETIGDAYWCAVGLEEEADPLDAARLTGMALRMQDVLREGIAALSGLSMSMRIALHVGTCMGGIVGQKNPRFHLFGSNVDIVMALEPCGTSSGVVMSSAFVHLLASLKPSAHSLASFGAGDAGMHTKDAKSKSQQKSRHDQINMVFDSLRQKYGMHIDNAEVRLAADACCEAAYRALRRHAAQLDAPDPSTDMHTDYTDMHKGCCTFDGRDASATGITGTHKSHTQDTHALDVREYSCSDAAKMAKLLAVSKDSVMTTVFPIYIISPLSAAFPIYRRRRSSSSLSSPLT